ncbi:MAG: fatty acid desaturase family protein [Paracoccaceae bacterium]|nr:fatty acid desaturase family protein [Paracoccaceae bacterium]
MGLLNLISFPTERSYALTGPEAQEAVDKGLANAEWYRTPVDRKVLKRLMKRSDGPALRDTALWLGLLVGFGAAGIGLWGTWWAVPVFVIYGILYASAADSRWHECGHGTAFKTRWMNDAVYELASFLMMRNSVVWRWSHARHHTDTIIVGRDPEISAMRPPQLIIIGLNFLGLVSVPQSFAALARNAMGRLSADEADYVPDSERARAFAVARVHMAVYAAVLVACFALGSILPAMLIGLPRAYGIWLLLVMGLPQHIGLAEDVLDHRLNSRTVLMNPVLRFIYSNMNYHMEHHMYPMVPYHALPALHEAVKYDCPAPTPSLWAAWREIVPCVLRQLRDPHHFIRPELPSGAGQPAWGAAAQAAE